MTFRQFHNGLRVLLNIDQPEFMDAVYPDLPVGQGMPVEAAALRDWTSFSKNPYDWFIRASDRKAEAVWKIVEERNSTAGRD